MSTSRGHSIYTSTKFASRARASSRTARYGDTAATITTTPWRDSSSQTKAMRLTFSSRSSLLNPRPFDRRVRTTSPSRTSTRSPDARSRCSSNLAAVDLPAPDRPVNQTTTPFRRSWRDVTELLIRKVRPQSLELRHEIGIDFPLSQRGKKLGRTALHALADHGAFGQPRNDLPDAELMIDLLHVAERRSPADFTDHEIGRAHV